MVKTKSNLFKPSLLTIALITAGMSAGVVSAADRNTETVVKAVQSKPVTASEHYAQIEEETEQTETSENTESEALPEGETLVITGYRGSLIRSIDEKRHADTVTEQLSADDLGSLPDISIADALTRLPGISAVRTGGKASEINIRGLSGIYVHTTLNGREQVSTSGTRSVEFAQYPSELISGATVYKSQKSSLIEGGVAGTVELRTASPLDNRLQHTFNVNARGAYNDRANEIYDAKGTGNRFSLSYQGKFADDTLGIAVGYARLFQPSVATQFIGFSYGALRDVDNLANDTEGPVGCRNCEYQSFGFEMQHKGGETTRDGYVAVIEWAPTNTFSLKADAFISKFDEKAFARGFRVLLDPDEANVANAVVHDNTVIGADYTRARLGGNTRIEISNDNNTKIDDSEAFGLKAVWEANDQFTFFTDLSRSTGTSDFKNGLIRSLVGVDATVDNPVFDENVSVSYRLNGLNLPDVGFNQDFTDIDKVMASSYGTWPYQYSDALNAIRFDGIYETRNNDVFSSFEGGLRYSERHYRNKRSVFYHGSDGEFRTDEAPLRLTNDMVTVVNFTGPFSGFPSYLAIDYNAALNAWFPNGVPQPITSWGADADGLVDNSSDWTMLESGKVWEDVTTAYFQANLDMLIKDTPVTGNVGLRAVTTNQSATTMLDVDGDINQGAQSITDDYGLVNSDYAPGIEGIEYTDYLPSLNLNFKLTDDSQIRFAAARVMARSPINRLSSNASGQFDEVTGEYHYSTTSSPKLKPFLANQYDLSYEYFFTETEGAFVVALFQKDLKSFVQEFTIEDYDFAANGFNLPEYVPGTDPNAPPVTVINGDYTEAVNNANGGYMRGIELAYTQVFTNLPELWSGLGVSASYAYTESEIDRIKGLTEMDLGGPRVKTSFPGLSKHVVNGAVFWNYKEFDTRINMRYRSKFVSTQWGVDEQKAFFDDEMVFDYQASYNIDDQFSVMFQATNLTDEPTKSYFNQKAQTGTIQFFGRQYFLGVNYKM